MKKLKIQANTVSILRRLIYNVAMEFCKHRILMMSRAKALLLVILAVFILSETVDAADSIPDFTFKSIDGKTITKKDAEGTPMVISIIATWCAPCKKEAPEFQRAHLAYKDRGVLFLGVFIGSKEQSIRKFRDKYGLTFPVGMDSDLAEKLDARSVPLTLFISRDGKIIKRHFGGMDYQKIVLEIEEILR